MIPHEPATAADGEDQYAKGLACARSGDYVGAAQCFEAAASKGHAGALFGLGVAYLEGKGKERDDRTALEIFRRGACHVHAPSQWFLGRMWLRGRGVGPDDRHAYKWLTVAARYIKDQRLNNDLNAVRCRLNDAQLQEAHQAAERILRESSSLSWRALNACPVCQEPECLEHVYGDDGIADFVEKEASRPLSHPVPYRYSADEEFGQGVHTAIRKVEDMG